MNADLVHNPADLSFERFGQLNDACFLNEPVGEVELGEYRCVDHWIVCPDFPGCSPFALSEPQACAKDLLSTLTKFANDGKLDLRITTTDQHVIDILRQAGTAENYRLYTMALQLD